MSQIENVIIVGSGPAGYTAAIYTARAELNPLVIEGFMWGGLLQETTDVENYPGFPEGVMGPQMMQNFRDQAERFGARLITDEATEITPATTPGGLHSVTVGGETYQSKTVILAMGAKHRKIGAPGEEELSGRGVSYCATCDAAFFKGHETVIVGGGDSAMEEATFLAKFASKVTIINRRSEFRASKIMLERAQATENIEWLNPYVVDEFIAGDNGSLATIKLKNSDDGSEKVIAASAAFIAIGHEPQSELVKGVVDTNAEGYISTEGVSTKTNIAGIFAAGDLVDHTYRQAITAAGSGCKAALDAEWYLAAQ